MKYCIENKDFKVEILEKGAELCSFFNKKSKLEYIWQANPAHWNKHSPVLFPIVGSLFNNQYTFKGQSYQMSRHGFARDSDFEMIKQTDNEITFQLQSNEKTLVCFPFHFSLKIIYTLVQNQLYIIYEVINKSEGQMYFSIGAHPAFNVPLNTSLNFEDYALHFDAVENDGIYPLNEQGCTLKKAIPFFKNSQNIALQKSLFQKDALVFKSIKSETISLQSTIDHHYVKVHFKGFPYLGIWSKYGADFVCIEPWHGITDNEHSNGILQDKEGIIALTANEIFRKEWSIEVG